jgi:RNA polymerase sigma factor (TIGR02999 family)
MFHLAGAVPPQVALLEVLAMTEVSRILSAIERGDRLAAEQLLPVVYDELRRLAAQKLSHERPGHTLDATALVHEAYVRLVQGGEASTAREPHWDSRSHFFAAAAEAMRRILVEKARHKRRLRHGGARRRVVLSDHPAAQPSDDLLALDEALTLLAAEDPVAAKIVELRHFAGLGHEAVAATLGLTVYQARQKWTYARAWLRDALDTER